MTITVNNQRRAVIDAPAIFSLENAPVVIKGIAADTATLKLVLYAMEGPTLAECVTWTGDATAGYSGMLDSRTVPALALFAGKRPDDRQPVILALADANRLWFVQGVEIANNPLIVTPVAPDPAPVYVTTEMFADLPVLSDDPTDDERNAFIRALCAIVRPA